MCNRYRMTANRAELAARYGIIGFPPDLQLPPPELFPKRMAWTIRDEDGERVPEPMA
jgi:putative SOS response-associated peptidase YedK